MSNLIDKIGEKVIPVANWFSTNHWISAIQKAYVEIMPLILVGSMITLYNSVIRYYIPSLPDLNIINTYSMGLTAVVLAVVLPLALAENLKMTKKKNIAILCSVCLFFMLLNILEFDSSKVGMSGLLVAMCTGLFSGLVVKICLNISLFKKDSLIPDFVKGMFDNIIPLVICLIVGFLISDVFKLDAFQIITVIFSPLTNFSNTLPGFIILALLPAITNTFGISCHVWGALINPIVFANIAANQENALAGLAAVCIFVQPVRLWLNIGGSGGTFALQIMSLNAKSNKYKSLSRACFIPSLFQVNEPLLFGMVAFNPILMIPMWISNIIVPAIAWFAFYAGWVYIPLENSNLWFMPPFINAWLATGKLSPVILSIVLFIIYYIIYIPFFRIADKNELELEKKESENYANEK